MSRVPMLSGRTVHGGREPVLVSRHPAADNPNPSVVTKTSEPEGKPQPWSPLFILKLTSRIEKTEIDPDTRNCYVMLAPQ